MTSPCFASAIWGLPLILCSTDNILLTGDLTYEKVQDQKYSENHRRYLCAAAPRHYLRRTMRGVRISHSPDSARLFGQLYLGLSLSDTDAHQRLHDVLPDSVGRLSRGGALWRHTHPWRHAGHDHIAGRDQQNRRAYGPLQQREPAGFRTPYRKRRRAGRNCGRPSDRHSGENDPPYCAEVARRSFYPAADHAPMCNPLYHAHHAAIWLRLGRYRMVVQQGLPVPESFREGPLRLSRRSRFSPDGSCRHASWPGGPVQRSAAGARFCYPLPGTGHGRSGTGRRGARPVEKSEKGRKQRSLFSYRRRAAGRISGRGRTADLWRHTSAR